MVSLLEQHCIVAHLDSGRSQDEEIKRQQQTTQVKPDKAIHSILSKAFGGNRESTFFIL